MTRPPIATLGLDLGTSSVKAVLLDPAGQVLATASVALGLHEGCPHAAEQDAKAWWQAAVAAIRSCRERAGSATVTAVGLTGQKHALLPLDAGGSPLRHAVLWADGRAVAEAEEQSRRLPRLPARTGAPALPGYLVPKWLRFRRREGALAARTAHLCFAKDWLRLCLTGTYATDPTEASASQLYDARTRTWSPELCRLFDVPLATLPPIAASTDEAGRVTAAAAAATGIPAGTPVVGGAGDNEAAALACGAVTEGVVAIVLGTSGTVIAPARRRGVTPGIVWGRHVTRRGLAATGVVLSAGRAVDWARRALFGVDGSFETLIAAAEVGLAAPTRPLFLPTLAGERSPRPDAEARGAFVDVGPEHGREQLAAAVLEGTAAMLGQAVEALRRSGVAVREVRLTSGGAASDAWRRLVVAAAGVEARDAPGAEGPARGAALLAGVVGASDRELLARASRLTEGEGTWTAPEEEVVRMGAVGRRLLAVQEALRRTR